MRHHPVPYAALALAMVASGAFLLWLTRGFTFYNDELGWFVSAPTDYAPQVILMPHNTHLIAIPRLIYTTSLTLFGPSYLPLRVISVVGVLVCAALFFTLARRRVGPTVALAGTVVLLFFGTPWEVTVSPIGIPFLYATVFGLGSFLALERRDRRGDIIACLLLVASLASHSIGLMFLVGVAVAVLLEKDRLRRAWVFGVPLALYALWWALAPESPSKGHSLAEAANVLGLSLFAFLSLGAVVDALLGLNLDPRSGAIVGFNRTPMFTWVLAPVLALAALVALFLRLRRGGMPRGFWGFAAAALALWIFTGLSAGPGRGPTTERYLYPAGAVVLLAAAEAARRVRLSRRGLVVVYGLAAISVAVNVTHALDARRFQTAFASNVGPTEAMLELAGKNADANFEPGRDAPNASPRHFGLRTGGYLRGVAKWGSPASTLDEVRRAPAVVRDRADVVLARALAVRAVPVVGATSSRRCISHRSAPGGLQVVELPPGGATLESVRGSGGPIALRRFGGSFAAEAGDLPSRETVVLALPPDAAHEPWFASLPGGTIRVCALTTQAATAVYCRLTERLERAGARLRSLTSEHAPPGQVAAARRNLFSLSRNARGALAVLTPQEIRDDLRTLNLSLIGRAAPRDAQVARGRVQRFQRRHCGPRPGATGRAG